MVATVAGILAIGAEAKWSDWQRFQTDLAGYRGINIGQTKRDVEYVLSVPDTVQGPMVKDNGNEVSVPLLVNALAHNKLVPKDYPPLPKDKSHESYDGWHYWTDAGTLDLDFDPKTGRLKEITCWQEHREDSSLGPACAPLFGISQGISEDRVRELLGKPEKEETVGGGTFLGYPIEVQKNLTYAAIGIRVRLGQRKVDSLEKVKPATNGLAWWLAHRLF